jgi:hypothetical protein
VCPRPCSRVLEITRRRKKTPAEGGKVCLLCASILPTYQKSLQRPPKFSRLCLWSRRRTKRDAMCLLARWEFEHASWSTRVCGYHCTTPRRPPLYKAWNDGLMCRAVPCRTVPCLVVSSCKPNSEASYTSSSSLQVRETSWARYTRSGSCVWKRVGRLDVGELQGREMGKE